MNEVLSTLVGIEVNEPSQVIVQGWTVGDTAVTGCVIKLNKAHSICSGMVLAVEKDPKDNTWCVTVEVNSQRWVRYCHLSSAVSIVGQRLKLEDSIGFACNGTIRLEYCTADKSRFPVRIGSRQLYKQDPTPIVFGQEILSEVL